MVIVGFCMILWVSFSMLILFQHPKTVTPGMVMLIVILGMVIFFSANGMHQAALDWYARLQTATH